MLRHGENSLEVSEFLTIIRLKGKLIILKSTQQVYRFDTVTGSKVRMIRIGNFRSMSYTPCSLIVQSFN